MPAPRQPDARANALIAAYELAGYVRVEPPILQPAEPFLDLSGEDIRRRMFLIADAANTELCLRPDLTIPVACDYLASPDAGKPAKYCYLGPVFRDLGARSAELMQAGIESFGRADTAAADAETIALALEATARYGLGAPDIRMGDVGLFAGLIESLDLVITVDTSVAHLAGALGKPVWIMLAALPDWRWGASGNESVWYPSARLFRQQTPGDWSGVVAQLVDALT